MNSLKPIFYQLGRPFSYLTIKHEEKYIYDWVIPLISTVLIQLYIHFILSNSPNFSVGQLISSLLDFLQVLPGFFIAALAAVATFNNPQIDQIMKNPPKIQLEYYGQLIFIEMTRRRFLCVLFAYLTAISISLIVISRIVLETPTIENQPTWSNTLLLGATSLFFIFFWQMIVATLLGLYYLGERLHTPDMEETSDKED